MSESYRKADEDFLSYLAHNRESFDLQDIQTVVACIAGHNDGDCWYWIWLHKDGRYGLTSAWCDYTGWDSQSGGSTSFHATALEAAYAAPVSEQDYRQPQRNLLAQVLGQVSYGVELIFPQEEQKHV